MLRAAPPTWTASPAPRCRGYLLQKAAAVLEGARGRGAETGFGAGVRGLGPGPVLRACPVSPRSSRTFYTRRPIWPSPCAVSTALPGTNERGRAPCAGSRRGLRGWGALCRALTPPGWSPPVTVSEGAASTILPRQGSSAPGHAKPTTLRSRNTINSQRELLSFLVLRDLVTFSFQFPISSGVMAMSHPLSSRKLLGPLFPPRLLCT